MEKPSRAIHIAPLGGENERISKPAIDYDADRVILIEYLPQTGPLKQVHEELYDALDDAGIEYEKMHSKATDLYESIADVAQTIDQQRSKDEVYVNISSGNKIWAVASMIACMSTGEATPYYADPKRAGSDYPKPARGIESVKSIPNYRVEEPRLEWVTIMHYIMTQNTEMRDTDEPFRTKSELIQFAEEHELPFIRDTDAGQNGKHNLLRHHVIEPMAERGSITIRERGSSDRVMLTEYGKGIYHSFRYRLEDADYTFDEPSN